MIKDSQYWIIILDADGLQKNQTLFLDSVL